MKNPDIMVYFQGMHEAIEKIFDKSKGKSLFDLEKDDTLQLAIERLFEILGEAANRIPKEYQINYPNIPWSQIIGMRNVIIHSYDKVDSEQLFLTIQRDLPMLKSELNKII